MPSPRRNSRECIMAVRCGSPANLFNRQPLLSAAAAVVASGIMLGSACAQTHEQNWARCKDADPDLSIGACTALIQSGEKSKSLLAAAFSYRGIGYARKGEYYQAIRDYDQAIQLAPDFAIVFNNRGN